MITESRYLLSIVTALILLTGCGSKEPSTTQSTADSAPKNPAEIPAEIMEYFQTKVFLGPDVYEDLEAGRISQEEIDTRTAAGEFPNLFNFSNIKDLPKDLKWENGMDLPDLGSPDAKKGGIFYDFINDFPRSLQTIGPDGSGSFRPYLLDYTTLALAKRHPNDTEITETGFRYFAELAEEWAFDIENNTAYIRLNPNATWSDGVPISANDFLYTIYFHQSEHIQDPWYTNHYNRNFSNLTKYDDLTFSITKPERKPDMTTRFLEMIPKPMHFFGVMDEDYVDKFQWIFQPTTGPYVIHEKDINKGRFIRLTRNKNWWAKDNKFQKNRFNFDIIHINVIRDHDKALEAFTKGELDIFDLKLTAYWHEKLPNDHEMVQKGYIHKYKFFNDLPRPSYAIRMNTAVPPLDNRDIRIGLQHSINWQRVIDEYSQGDYVRMNGNSAGYGAFVNPDIKAYPFSVEKALDHFKKAGYSSRNDEGILKNSSGKPLAITLTTPWAHAANDLTIIQEEARRAGVDIKLEILDLTTGYKKLSEKKHQLGFCAFGIAPEMYPRYYGSYHSTQSYDQAFLPDGSVNPDRKLKANTNNFQSYANPEVDELIEKYRASEDANEMRELAFKLQEVIHNEASFVPAYIRPFTRTGAWRWVKWPDDFDVRITEEFRNYYLMWIDEEDKAATLKALKSGQTFDPVVKTYDQYNVYK